MDRAPSLSAQSIHVIPLRDGNMVAQHTVHF